MHRLHSHSRSSSSLRVAGLLLVLSSGVACDATLATSSPGDAGQSRSTRGDPSTSPPNGEVLVDGEHYEPECDEEEHGNVALRLLTPSQYSHALATTFSKLNIKANDLEIALPLPSSAAGYATNAEKAAGDTELESLLLVAESMAQAVVSQFDSLMNCDPSEDCVDEFLSLYGRRLFRGNVPEQERTELLALYRSAPNESEGLNLLTMGLLLSAPVLYQVEERSDERRALSGNELASKMALLLWDSIPDEDLLDAAEKGKLESEEGLRQEVQRMLDDSRTQRMLESFYTQWLGLVALHPGETTTLDEEVLRSIRHESVSFATHFTLKESGTYRDLLFSRLGFVDEEVAKLYDIAPGADGEAVELPDERAGILTRAGFLAASSHLTDTAPTIRGAQIRERFLCQVVPSPPASVQDMFPELPSDPNLSKREKLELHQAPGCTGCHILLDPIGFSFEAYDQHGRYRTEYDNGDPIDARGEVTAITKNAEEIQGKFDGPEGLAELISTSQTGRDCFVEQWFHFALQRRVASLDACAFEQLRAGFHNSDYSLVALIESVVLNPAFRFRNAED